MEGGKVTGAWVLESSGVTAQLSLRDSAAVTMKIRDSQPCWVVLTDGTLLLAFTSFSFDESLKVTISSCGGSSTNIPFPVLEITKNQEDCKLPVLGEFPRRRRPSSRGDSEFRVITQCQQQ